MGFMIEGLSAPRASNMLILESSENRVHLLELFSTESCSSCPPADQWMGSLRRSPGLWKSFVPVVAHVHYWDYLGWKDPFSSPENTARQKAYVATWKGGYAYTPNFVLDGADWRGQRLRDLSESSQKVGVLKATQTGTSSYQIEFHPSSGIAKSYQVHGSLLGNGIEVDVRRGENAGKKLKHHFLTLDHQTNSMSPSAKGSFFAKLNFNATRDARAESMSIAFWVSEAGNPRPLQAVGADLERGSK